jgi:hypothetical protein
MPPACPQRGVGIRGEGDSSVASIPCRDTYAVEPLLKLDRKRRIRVQRAAGTEEVTMTQPRR